MSGRQGLIHLGGSILFVLVSIHQNGLEVDGLRTMRIISSSTMVILVSVMTICDGLKNCLTYVRQAVYQDAYRQHFKYF